MEGTSISFSATVGDDRGAETLTIEWFDDRDGLLDESPPTRTGMLAFSTDALSVGDHLVTLTAYDPDGGQAQASVSFTVVPADLPPTAPTVVVEPADPTTDDDLTCMVTIASTDPEGVAVTHRFAWLRDGSSTAFSDRPRRGEHSGRTDMDMRGRGARRHDRRPRRIGRGHGRERHPERRLGEFGTIPRLRRHRLVVRAVRLVRRRW